MTDQRLRELERRFRESGSVDDEAAWLTERLRIGQISKFELHLAGWLCHEACSSIYQFPHHEAPRFSQSRQWLECLLSLIDGCPHETFAQLNVRMICTAFLMIYPNFDQDYHCLRAMTAVARWLASPTPHQAQLARAIHNPGINVEPTLGVWNAHAPPLDIPPSLEETTRRSIANHVLAQVSATLMPKSEAYMVLKSAVEAVHLHKSNWFFQHREQLGLVLAPLILGYNTDPVLDELNARLIDLGP